jgi:hypothetical protein
MLWWYVGCGRCDWAYFWIRWASGLLGTGVDETGVGTGDSLALRLDCSKRVWTFAGTAVQPCSLIGSEDIFGYLRLVATLDDRDLANAGGNGKTGVDAYISPPI